MTFGVGAVGNTRSISFLSSFLLLYLVLYLFTSPDSYPWLKVCNRILCKQSRLERYRESRLRMTNIIYVRPVYIDESSVEGSETLSAAGHDDDENGVLSGQGRANNRLQTKMELLLLTRMNCFAAHFSSARKLIISKNPPNHLIGEQLAAGSARKLIISKNPQNHLIGEQLAAGWPSWLSNNASKAINGWTPRRIDSFENLHKDETWEGTRNVDGLNIARDTLTGKHVVLKMVKLDFYKERESFLRSMASEILILRRLDHPNVIKLEGLAISERSFDLSLVFEYVDIGRAGLTLINTIKFTEPQVKCYMHQLLSGLEHCHSHGVFHREISKANLLVNSEGILKIADFGSVIKFHHRQPYCYRAPELLLGDTESENDGVALDLWSTGCILAELLAGRPIMPGHTKVEQLNKIFELCGSPSEEYWKNSKLHVNKFGLLNTSRRCIAETFKYFPPSSVPLIETLLAVDPVHRQTATAALSSQFFTSIPQACTPSGLPRKEIASILASKETSWWDSWDMLDGSIL